MDTRARTSRWSARALLAALAAAFALAAAPARADETPRVELYTMGLGDSLFEVFGHAAMCLRYPGAPGRDLCFNYGTADFSDPADLILRFLRGEAEFWVS